MIKFVMGMINETLETRGEPFRRRHDLHLHRGHSADALVQSNLQ